MSLTKVKNLTHKSHQITKIARMYVEHMSFENDIFKVKKKEMVVC